MPLPMHPKLQELVEGLESQRKSVLNDFRGFSAQQLQHIPQPGKWSAAEILSHIITAERLSVAYMNKKVQGIDQAARTGLVQEAKVAILKISQRLPGLKFKAPKRVVENTTSYQDLAAIEAAWEASRLDLRRLLEQIPDRYIDRMIYKHPFAGYLNVQHALIFFREHIVHHVPQLKKLLK